MRIAKSRAANPLREAADDQPNLVTEHVRQSSALEIVGADYRDVRTAGANLGLQELEVAEVGVRGPEAKIDVTGLAGEDDAPTAVVKPPILTNGEHSPGQQCADPRLAEVMCRPSLESNFLDRFHRTLSQRVKLAQGLDRVAHELDAQRVVRSIRKHVEDAAAHRILAGLGRQVGQVIPGILQPDPGPVPVCRRAGLERNLEFRAGDPLDRAGPERARVGNDDQRPARLHPVEQAQLGRRVGKEHEYLVGLEQRLKVAVKMLPLCFIIVHKQNRLPGVAEQQHQKQACARAGKAGYPQLA